MNTESYKARTLGTSPRRINAIRGYIEWATGHAGRLMSEPEGAHYTTVDWWPSLVLQYLGVLGEKRRVPYSERSNWDPRDRTPTTVYSIDLQRAAEVKQTLHQVGRERHTGFVTLDEVNSRLNRLYERVGKRPL